MIALFSFRRHLPLIAAGILCLVALVGAYRLSSYLRTGQRLVGTEIQDRIPRSFELERCRTMIDDLDQRIAEHRGRLVALEVDRATLADEHEAVTGDLTTGRDQLRRLQSLLEKDQGGRFLGRHWQPQELRREAARRAGRVEHLQALEAAKAQALSAIDRTLEQAGSHLARAETNRDDYRLRLEQLQAQAEQVAIRSELQVASSELPGFDDELLDEVDGTFRRLERNLAIQQRQLDLAVPEPAPGPGDRLAVEERLQRLLEPATTAR